jgi:hypothetical protein
MSEVQDDFKPRKILAVKQEVRTIVFYQELDENEEGISREVVVHSYIRDLPEPS